MKSVFLLEILLKLLSWRERITPRRKFDNPVYAPTPQVPLVGSLSLPTSESPSLLARLFDFSHPKIRSGNRWIQDNADRLKHRSCGLNFEAV
jgi:hypothetical protein